MKLLKTVKKKIVLSIAIENKLNFPKHLVNTSTKELKASLIHLQEFNNIHDYIYILVRYGHIFLSY